MNIYTNFNRVSAQFVAAIAMFAMLLSALPVHFFVAEAVAGSVERASDNAHFADLQSAIDDSGTLNGDTLVLLDDVVTAAQVTVSKSITIDGDGHQLDAQFSKTSNSNNAAIGVQADNVIITDITVDNTPVSAYPSQLHGINIYNVTGIELDTVTATNFEGSGIVVNSSEVTARDITTSGNGWHAINVDSKTNNVASLTIEKTSSHAEDSAMPPSTSLPSNTPHIYIDDTSKGTTVIDADNQYQFANFGDARVYTLGDLRICHASKSHSNPYIGNAPDETADAGGHDGHGPDNVVWFDGINSDWGDIIPPFGYDGGYYPGKNWTTEGQDIWENDCKVPDADYGSITITKEVKGGDATVEDFTLYVDAHEVESGVSEDFMVHSKSGSLFTISEVANVDNYTQESLVCSRKDDKLTDASDKDGFQVKLKRDWEVTCTIVNVHEPTVSEPVCETGDNLLLNASFEEPKVDTDWALFDIIPNWVSNIGTDGIELQRGLFGGAADGKQHVELDARESTELTQTVATIPGATYELRFDFKARTVSEADNSVEATADGAVVVSAATDNTDWTEYSSTFVATDTSTDITFADKGTSNGTGTLIDDTVLCLVEEPKPEVYQCEAGLLFLDTETDAPEMVSLHTVNDTDGTAALFAEYDLDLLPVLAVADDETIYAIEKETGDLLTLDNDLGAYSVIGDTGIAKQKPVAMDFAPDGTLYVLTEKNDTLYTIDTGSGIATLAHGLDLDVSGGDVVFEGYNTDSKIVYVQNNGNVHGIDPVTFDESLLGTLTLDGNKVTSAATKDGVHYAYTREDSFHPFTLSPFVEEASISQTGPFAWGDGSYCPAEPVKTCEVEIVSDTTDYVVEKDAPAETLSFIHSEWKAVIPGATWIWGDDPVVDPKTEETQTFLKQFAFEGVVTSATLTIASDNTHSASVNDNASHDGGSTFGAEVSYDVTGEIFQGNNELEIAVTNLAGSANPASNPAGLLYKLHIEGEVTTDDDCVIPYEEDRGELIVKKVVEGGQLTADAFTFQVENMDPVAFDVDGENVVILETGSYDIAEIDVPANYEVSYDNCEDVAVASDHDETPVCTITNTYVEPLVCEQGKELIANGSFEAPVVDNDADWDIFDLTTYPSLAWAVEFVDSFAGAPDEASLELHAGVNGWLPSEGDQYAELDADWEGPGGPSGEEASVMISQNIDTIPGEEYTLSWDFSPRPDTNQPENDLEVFIEGAQVANNTAAGTGVNTWTSDSYTFTATENETTIAFTDDGEANSQGTFLDNVSLTCNPEPEMVYGPYCGDGEVNQDWEQCEPGDTGCTDYCLMENMCHTERLVKITMDATDSVSFNDTVYLGSDSNPIPNGTWFNFDELGDDTVNDIATEDNGLAVSRDTVTGELVLGFRGGNESKETDQAKGSIATMGIDLGSPDRNPIVGWPLEDGNNGFNDVFDVNQTDNTVMFDMRADTGRDAVSVPVTDGEAYGQCGDGDGPISFSRSSGGSPSPRCDLFEAEIVDGEVVLTWETDNGLDLSIEAEGSEIYFEEDNDTVEEGSFTTATGPREYLLTVNRGTKDDTCSVEVGPDGGVLGATADDNQVTIIPLGAADAGNGGATPLHAASTLLAAAFAGRNTRKNV